MKLLSRPLLAVVLAVVCHLALLVLPGPLARPDVPEPPLQLLVVAPAARGTPAAAGDKRAASTVRHAQATAPELPGAPPAATAAVATAPAVEPAGSGPSQAVIQTEAAHAAESTPAPQAAAPAVTTAATPLPTVPSANSAADVFVPATANADYLETAPGDYPPLARQMNLEGTVRVRVRVGTDGKPLEARALPAPGMGVFNRAAERTVMRYRFVPARRGQQAVEDVIVIPVVFQLLD